MNDGHLRVIPEPVLRMLHCPISGTGVSLQGGSLVCESGCHRFRISETGIPLFAEAYLSDEAQAQREHYDRIAGAYLTNLSYPHTQEYTAYLDRAFLDLLYEGRDGARRDPGRVAEICCGRGEAFHLLRDRVTTGVGVDVSLAMLEAARAEFAREGFTFLQGDATRLPLKAAQFDTVVVLGGIHHVADRKRLFSEIHRILVPGGLFCFREPVSDFFLWRGIRWVVYRLSPTLDHATERPLLWSETVPPLQQAGFDLRAWKTCGLLGFCLLMNSDVLVFNRVFRFIPGIRSIARTMAQMDAMMLKLPGVRNAGLQVVGAAVKAGH